MRRQRGLLRGGTIAVILMAASMPALAGRTDTDGNPPTEGSTHGSGWNPSFTCTIAPGETLDDLLECLADGLSHQGPGPCPLTTVETLQTIGEDPGPASNLQPNLGGSGCSNQPMAPPGFWVTRWLPSPPHYGLDIRKIDGSEIDRLLLWEDDPAIQMTHIEVEREGLGARIATFAERPAPGGGFVTLTVNGIAVSLDTALLRKPVDLSHELVAQLHGRGFHAWIADLYIVIVTNPPSAGIRSLEFQSGNPGIISSDLALLPLDELPVTIETEQLVTPLTRSTISPPAP